MATTYYLCQSIFNGSRANRCSPFCVGYKLPSEGCVTGRQSLENYVIGKHIGQCIPAHLVLAAGMISLQSASLIKSSLTIRLSRSYSFSHDECSVSELQSVWKRVWLQSQKAQDDRLVFPGCMKLQHKQMVCRASEKILRDVENGRQKLRLCSLSLCVQGFGKLIPFESPKGVFTPHR